jgi:transposase InsO family protein
MRSLGIQGAVRGKAVKTTISDKATPCPADRVNRQFQAPRANTLWVSDFTYVSTWQGFVYTAFVIDAFARRIVGWRVSSTASAGLVLDALEQALHDRRPVRRGSLIHHSDPSRVSWPFRLWRSDRSPADDRWRTKRLDQIHRTPRRGWSRSAASGTVTTMPLRGLLAASPSEIGSKASWPSMAERVIGSTRPR